MAVNVHTVDFKTMTSFGLVGGCRHSCPEGIRRHRSVKGQQRSRLSAGYIIGVVGSNSAVSTFLCVLSWWAAKAAVRSQFFRRHTAVSARRQEAADSSRRFVRWARYVARMGYIQGFGGEI